MFLKNRRCILFVLLNFSLANNVIAADYASFTFDNDIFVGSDDGYTNGLFVSLYYFGDENYSLKPRWLLKPVAWTLPRTLGNATASIYTFGQAMVTPEDIETESPDPEDVPYGGLFVFTNSFLVIHERYTDKVSTSIGIIGPASGAEPSQKFVHQILGSDTPKGWDAQLENELVFQFSRGRVWRAWVSKSQQFDLLLGADLAIGTLESQLSTGAMIRMGNGLERSYPSPALNNSRATNPVAVNGGWFIYLGLGASFIGNQIFVNGNTFKDSPSVELDHTQIGAITGLSYSTGKYSFALAIEDLTLFEDSLEGVTRFGTFTLAWQL